MENNRRSFLGMLASVLAMPAVGAIVPNEPVRKRGETTAIFHIDEFAFQAHLTGKSGQVLVVGENGPEWQDPPKNWIVSDMRHMQMPADTSMYQQTYSIPVNRPKTYMGTQVANPLPEKTYALAFGGPLQVDGVWRQPKIINWAKIDKDFGDDAVATVENGWLRITVNGVTRWGEHV